MRSFLRFALLALMLLVVALVSALTAMRFAIHTSEVVVPNLVGKTPIEGQKIAEDSGLQMEVERRYYSPTTPEGKILSQLPPADTQVRRGWQIRVALSLDRSESRFQACSVRASALPRSTSDAAGLTLVLSPSCRCQTHPPTKCCPRVRCPTPVASLPQKSVF